jgi:hypothetical protein
MSIGNEYPNEPFPRWRHQRTLLACESKRVTLAYQEASLNVDHRDATMSRGTRVSMAGVSLAWSGSTRGQYLRFCQQKGSV